MASATTADQTATSCPVAVACVSTMTMPSGSLSFSFSFNSDSKLSLGLHRAPARGFSGSSVSAARLFPPASFAARGEDDEEEQQREVAQDGRRAKVRMSKLLERLGGDGAEAEAEAEAEAREKAKAFLDWVRRRVWDVRAALRRRLRQTTTMPTPTTQNEQNSSRRGRTTASSFASFVGCVGARVVWSFKSCCRVVFCLQIRWRRRS